MADRDTQDSVSLIECMGRLYVRERSMNKKGFQIWGHAVDGPPFKVDTGHESLDDAKLDASRRTINSSLNFRYWVEIAAWIKSIQ